MVFLEPLVEVETPEGRIGYGPVQPADVAGLFDAGLLHGRRPRAAIGRPEEHPWLAGQARLTFARCGVVDPLSVADYRAHGGYAGLDRALAMGGTAIVDEVKLSGLRGRGGAGFPTGIKWNTVRLAPADQSYIVCNADEGDSGTFADRMLMEGDPLSLIEGMTIAGVAVGATKGFIYMPLRVPARLPHHAARHRRGGAGGLAGRRRVRLRARLRRWRCGWAPARISAARRRRCWKRWRASAAWCAPSRRCRRSRGCSASRPW